MEHPTSSNVTPTEHFSAKTAEVKVEGEFTVSKESHQNFLMAGGHDIKTAFKCSGCQCLTVHVGKEIIMYDAIGPTSYKPESLPKVLKRIMGCTNCGKISTK